MPALTAAPTVSVFHSINKISGAKVKKYTTASEKGLSVYEDNWASPAGVKVISSPSLRGTPSSVGPPSSKRRRLQPFNTNSAVSGVTFATPKRKRKPVRKIDLDKNMYFEDGITSLQEPEWLSDSEEAPSATSTLTPPPPSDKEPSPVRDAPTPEDLEYGRNFASYYILDDDDDDNNKGKKPATAPPVKAPRPAKKPEVPRQQPQGHPAQTPYYPAPQAQATHQNRARRARPSTSRPLPPPPQQFVPAVPPPRVTIIDNIKRNHNPNKPVTVAEMIAKLDVLSLALVKFGGTPPPQEAQNRASQARRNNSVAASANDGSTKSAANGQGDETVTGLLAMFDDDGDSDMADEDEGVDGGASECDTGLNYTLPATGTPDTDLSYGVQFIMNALMTWAKQRIDAMYTQQWHQYNEMVRQQHQQHSQPKKGRGRPKKDELEQRPPMPQQPPPPSVVNAELTNTPEGEAVQAFQDVVDCGLLKVNTIMPKELTRALGTLYVQIDHLINNSAREEPRWQCMSYQAQVKAHNSKVQRWKEQMAKMQEEMSRQQELSHQQMMVQMGVPPHLQHRGSMSRDQALRNHDMSLELRRSGRDAQQQPHLTQYLTTPMDLDTQRTRPSVVPSSSASPANGGPVNVSYPPGQASYHHVDSATLHHSSRARDPMSHVTMYHDGRPANVAPEHVAQLQMRSGAGMKFSFEHNNETARQLFGHQAFPSPASASNIPRRGPMARPVDQPSTSQHSRSDNGVNGSLPTPVLASNAPPLNGHPKSAETVKVNGGEASLSGASSLVLDTNMNGIKSATTHINGHMHDTTKSNNKASETPAPSASSTKSPKSSCKRKHSETADASASSASPSSTEPRDPGKFKLRLNGKTRSSNGSRISATDDGALGDE